MADKKISALTGATTPLAGTEVLPIVQGGSTVKVSVANLTAGRAVNASTVTASGQVSGNYVTSSGNVESTGPNLGHAANRVIMSHEGGGNGYLQPYGSSAGAQGALSIRCMSSDGSLSTLAAQFDATKVTINTGNLVIGTAGKGIDFSANGGDVLSQYDEGTYTPVFTASSSNPTVTYGLQRGKYVRVGNTVTVSVFITWSALSGGSGDLQISLPFAGESSVGAGAAGAIADLTGFTFAAGRTFCSVRPNANVLYATFPQSGSAVSTSNTTVAQTASSGLIVFSCTYLI